MIRYIYRFCLKIYVLVLLDSRFRGNDEATRAKPVKTGKLKYDQVYIAVLSLFVQRID